MGHTHEIYDNCELVGTGTVLQDGDISITIGERFIGIYSTFDSWNIGKGYTLKEVPRADLDMLEDQLKGMGVEELSEEDLMNWPYGLSIDYGNPDDIIKNLNLDLYEDED